MRRAKLILLSAGLVLAMVIATAYALGAPDAQAALGLGRTEPPYGGIGTPSPTPPLCLPSYPVVVASSPSPSNGQADDQLHGIAAISATNIWAVGSTHNDAQPLIEHDNGSGWSIVAGPTLNNTESNILYGIAAVSASDIWAVGETTPIDGTGAPPSQPLIEHWNGTSWSLAASPTIPGTYTGFAMHAVEALASNDVWAVGNEYSTPSTTQLLVEHWNGSQWSLVPDTTSGAQLYSLAVLSDTNVWAAGTGNSSTAVNGGTFIEHYDGTSWSAMTSPSPGTWFNTLTGIAAASPTNIWAVGYWTNYEGEYNNETLVEHWNGTAWSTIASPDPGQLNDTFQAVGVDSIGGIWAVGGYQVSSTTEQALVERLVQSSSGESWRQETAQPSDPEGDNYFQINALAVISPASVLFAGIDYGNGSWFRTLVEQYRLLPGYVCAKSPQ